MIAPSEVVYYESRIDTHAIAELVIPIDGEYAYIPWGAEDVWKLKHFNNGDRLSAKRLMSSSCPGFDQVKKRVLGEKK